MIDLILKDSLLRPDLFVWRGSLPQLEIVRWEWEHGTTVPKDLKELWTMKGGGDLFESETILQPFDGDDDDLVLPRSRWFWAKGLDRSYYVFHEGMVISAFKKSNNSLCSLRSSNFTQIRTFESLDQWYTLTLRAEYADRYGLPHL